MTAIATPITQPFASARNDNIEPSTVPSDAVANQPNGFPIDQMKDPSDPNWQAVKEQEMNGVFNYYTNLLFELGQGKLFTFNQELSDKIIAGIKDVAGYPQGAILWCASNNTFQRSLKDGNTANFVTTPSYINDGINWVTEGAYPDIQDNSVTGAVIIGGRIAGSQQEIICNSAVTSNVVSKSIVSDSAVEMSVNTLTDTAGAECGYDVATGKLKRLYALGDYLNQQKSDASYITFKEVQSNTITKYWRGEGTPQYMTMMAVRGNNQWGVTLSGAINSTAISAGDYQANLDINAIFGITVKPDESTLTYGVATPFIAIFNINFLGGYSAVSPQNILSATIVLSSGAQGSQTLIAFSITFLADSITP